MVKVNDSQKNSPAGSTVESHTGGFCPDPGHKQMIIIKFLFTIAVKQSFTSTKTKFCQSVIGLSNCLICMNIPVKRLITYIQ